MIRRRTTPLLLIGLLTLFVQSAWSAEVVYLEPNAFIKRSFEGEPEQKLLWLNKELKASIKKILSRDFSGLRIRYWQKDNRTAWILEEIGKVKPITAGFLIEEGELLEMQVLIYRESHGQEVQYSFFTDQFNGLQLDDKQKLDKGIDGISGATLSVNALTRLSRLALFLSEQVEP
ncbi:MAG: FMN-binding protein [Verrucomicrobia bacterium]|nr:FMN-binding protein [Verrucomicrobiota bacterium]MDA1067214.1 FMN-binding protein [Verrucomicrobiota bacterium]